MKDKNQKELVQVGSWCFSKSTLPCKMVTFNLKCKQRPNKKAAFIYKSLKMKIKETNMYYKWRLLENV